jgi:hypothetical protein
MTTIEFLPYQKAMDQKYLQVLISRLRSQITMGNVASGASSISGQCIRLPPQIRNSQAINNNNNSNNNNNLN